MTWFSQNKISCSLPSSELKETFGTRVNRGVTGQSFYFFRLGPCIFSLMKNDMYLNFKIVFVFSLRGKVTLNVVLRHCLCHATSLPNFCA